MLKPFYKWLGKDRMISPSWFEAQRFSTTVAAFVPPAPLQFFSANSPETPSKLDKAIQEGRLKIHTSFQMETINFKKINGKLRTQELSWISLNKFNELRPAELLHVPKASRH